MWVNKDYGVYSILFANLYNMTSYVCISEKNESPEGA